MTEPWGREQRLATLYAKELKRRFSILTARDATSASLRGGEMPSVFVTAELRGRAVARPRATVVPADDPKQSAKRTMQNSQISMCSFRLQ